MVILVGAGDCTDVSLLIRGRHSFFLGQGGLKICQSGWREWVDRSEEEVDLLALPLVELVVLMEPLELTSGPMGEPWCGVFLGRLCNQAWTCSSPGHVSRTVDAELSFRYYLSSLPDSKFEKTTTLSTRLCSTTVAWIFTGR